MVKTKSEWMARIMNCSAGVFSFAHTCIIAHERLERRSISQILRCESERLWTAQPLVIS